jgi:hypothetical protein
MSRTSAACCSGVAGASRVSTPRSLIPSSTIRCVTSRRRQHLALEPSQRVGAKPVEQQPVAADAGVEHAQIARGRIGLQPRHQHVGPALVAVGGDAIAVGDRIAEDRHRAGAGGVDFDAADHVPARAGLRPVADRRRRPGRRARNSSSRAPRDGRSGGPAPWGDGG